MIHLSSRAQELQAKETNKALRNVHRSCLAQRSWSVAGKLEVNLGKSSRGEHFNGDGLSLAETTVQFSIVQFGCRISQVGMVFGSVDFFK